MIISLCTFKGGVGKTTVSIHLAAFLAEIYGGENVALIDSDSNESALTWSKRDDGDFLKFQTVGQSNAKSVSSRKFLVLDTQARPNAEDLKAIANNCDLLVLVTNPDVLSLDATARTIRQLNSIRGAKYRILINKVNPSALKSANQAIDTLQQNKLPVLNNWIRRYSCYEKAALQGCAVPHVKGDSRKRIAWSDCVSVFKELMGDINVK